MNVKEAIKTLEELLLDSDGNISIQGSKEDNRLITEAMKALNQIEFKDVWIAWTNTNLTDGYGTQYPMAICETLATANRLGKKGSVQGMDCSTSKEKAIKIDGKWMSHFMLQYPSKDDTKRQDEMDKQKQAEDKALELGLTPEEITALTARW